MEKRLEYRRMYETRNVRPYYTVPHLGGFGRSFKELTGFEYKKSIYVTSPDMNNEAYHEVGEMAKASEYFRKLWGDCARTQKLIRTIKTTFRKAVRIETHGWKQNWSMKATPTLIKEMRMFYGTLFETFTTMLISQPQHVVSLEEKISALIEGRQNRDAILAAATRFSGDLPWAREDREIGALSKRWWRLSQTKRREALKRLAAKYGWFNEIEGDAPFDEDHYRRKILDFEPEKQAVVSIIVPRKVRAVGKLIGELGFLRFWNRYHFMTVRFHLKKILEELVRRAGNPDLEYATVEEVERFFQKKKIDLKAIRQRKLGYASRLQSGTAMIVTGETAARLKDIVREDTAEIREIRGAIANRGKAVGRVRVVSFSASDYSEQVASFRKGEILVTGMTRPQIVHLCRKAAAIVTDEGGITSHAAVVSREFGIPCIMATHNATRILKTGDAVEVDAGNGIIRKIRNR